MRILVIGGGGREHALVWKLAQSKGVSAIFCAPGNPGMAPLAQCVNLGVEDHEEYHNGEVKRLLKKDSTYCPSRLRKLRNFTFFD